MRFLIEAMYNVHAVQGRPQLIHHDNLMDNALASNRPTKSWGRVFWLVDSALDTLAVHGGELQRHAGIWSHPSPRIQREREKLTCVCRPALKRIKIS